MKSKANIKGHPLHPILIPFPIAFFIGTLVFDILAVTKMIDNYWYTAGYLEIGGIGTGLLAAIPGFIDYFATVPPDSSAKKRATQHMLINISLIVIFAIALYCRTAASKQVVLILEFVGVILLFISGWLGGTLVYRNQIGVDPRYANAGKWKEAYFENAKDQIEVADAGELQTDQMKLLHVGNQRIVLGKTEDGYVAFDDRCTHKGGSLAGGMMMCGTVQCPWHGSQFDCKTGNVKSGPAKAKIKTYTIDERDGKVYIKV